MACCTLETARLKLRAPTANDIPSIASLIGDWDVAKNLACVPHPYTEDDARAFIARLAEQKAAGTDFNFAVVRKWDDVYIGGCGVHLREGGSFEFGYWLGKPFWGKGYATEAATRLAAFAFSTLKIGRLTAAWFHDNPASGHVLAKLGCRSAGTAQHDCISRGHAVYCHLVTLDRESFGQRKAA